MRKLIFLFALLCVSMAGWADGIDWSTASFVPGSTQYQVGALSTSDLPNEVVSIQKPGWAEEEGIYMTFPSSDQLSCSVDAAIQGAGMVVYLSDFQSATETEVTVSWNGGSRTFYVHNNNLMTLPAAKAESPDIAASNVRAVYSQYTLNTGMTRYGWSDGTTQNVIVDGRRFPSFKISSQLGLGIGRTNISMMDKLHLDVWAESSFDINVCLISDGAGEHNQTVSLTGNQWNSVNLSLDDFQATKTAVTAIKLSAPSVQNQLFFLDNIYFYSENNLPNPDPTDVYDTNLALSSNGGIAYPSTNNGENFAARAIDGDNSTQWESVQGSDPQTWTVDLGQRRIFNRLQIRWETAYARAFTISISDNATSWTQIAEETDYTAGGNDVEYQIELGENKTARYIRFNGTVRATGYGYSFKEFRVLLTGTPVLTSVGLASDKELVKVGEYATLSASPKDQNNDAIAATLSYTVSPADAGHVTDGKYYPEKFGLATITVAAEAGGVQVTNNIQIWGVTSDNLALNNALADGDDGYVGTYYNTDTPAKAVDGVDGNDENYWQGSTTNGNVEGSQEYDAWFVVDLKDYYALHLVTIHFEGACSDAYKLYVSTDNSNWDEAYSFAQTIGQSNHTDYISIDDLSNVDKVRYVKFHSTKASTGWGMKIYELQIYGTEWVDSDDTEAPVMVSASEDSKTFNSVTLAVSATDNGEVTRFHVVDETNGIDANFTPSDGKITITGLTHATDYNFIITAKDAAGNESENYIEVAVSTPFDGSINLALNKPCEAGYEPENTGEHSPKANDGQENTLWVTWNNRPAAEEWWYVDLGEIYNLSNITVLWGGDYSTKYILQARVEAPSAEDEANDAAWVTLATITDAAVDAEKSTNVSGVGRYVRIHSLAKLASCIRIREVRVYASGVAATDTEKPVMTSASLVSNTDSYAVIAVAATDNVGIAKYRVVDTDNSFDAEFVAEAGNITVTGLNGGTTYNFTITAIDFFGNESANSKSVEATTTAHYTEPQVACPVPAWDSELVKALYSPTYDANYTHQDWGSGTVDTVDVFGRKYITNELGYFGADGFSLNCLLMEKLHYDIWIADDATIRIVPIWGGTEQGITVNLIGQQWNSIDIALSEYSNITNWSNITQMKIDQAYNLTFWVGNAYFYRETAYVDTEAPTNASANKVTEGFYSVTINAQAEDNSGAVSFIVKDGDVEVATGAAASGVATTITVNNLTPGTAYNFNVIVADETGNALAPIAIAATTKAFPAAAPAPDFNGKLVIPVFTDAMAGAPAEIHSGGWGEATIHEWLNISANDKVFYVRNLNWAGWHSWGGDIDATGMQYLHVDVYSLGATSVNVTPISHDPTREGSSTIALTPNAWTSYDVPLSNYDAANIEWNKIFQFKFMNPVGGNELMIDNVYFYKNPSTITLDEEEDNSETLSDNDGKYVNVTLKRPFTDTEMNYTLCLPFDMSAEQLTEAFGAGWKLSKLSDDSYYKSGDAIRMIFDRASSLEAGVPYIFFPGENTAAPVTIEGVVIDATAPAVIGNNVVSMKGFYDPTSLPTASDWFLGTDNYLHKTTDGVKAYAFRAYFTLGTSVPAGVRARVVMRGEDANTATGINELNTTSETEKFFRDGQLLIRKNGSVYTTLGVRVE